jgi:uncharacterized integral membrane protein
MRGKHWRKTKLMPRSKQTNKVIIVIIIIIIIIIIIMISLTEIYVAIGN